MRGNELLEKMELIDPKYIEEADEAQVKKKAVWVRWAAMAACLCMVTAMAWFWKGNGEYLGFRRQEDDVGADSTNAAIEWAEWGETELVTEPYQISSNNGPVNGDQLILDGKPMISGFGETDINVDMSVTNGGFWLSPGLEGAMDHYGDTANYRVFVELFSDGVQIPSGGAQAVEEAARLRELGYIVAMESSTETVIDGEIATAYITYYFTLHATYEQLLDFQADENLGYKFMLYDEGPGTGQDRDVTSYNGCINPDEVESTDSTVTEGILDGGSDIGIDATP